MHFYLQFVTTQLPIVLSLTHEQWSLTGTITFNSQIHSSTLYSHFSTNIKLLYSVTRMHWYNRFIVMRNITRVQRLIPNPHRMHMLLMFDFSYHQGRFLSLSFIWVSWQEVSDDFDQHMEALGKSLLFRVVAGQTKSNETYTECVCI
jgi:hypothetical protein